MVAGHGWLYTLPTKADDFRQMKTEGVDMLNDDLPEPLKSVRTRPLFVMRLDVLPLQIVGATPGPYRRIGVVPGGTFEGERLSGTVLDGGSDWQAVHSDGSVQLDVRLVLKTHDDALIGMTCRGVRHGPADVIQTPGTG